jgi:predicted XRE-type DNA-binding protein
MSTKSPKSAHDITVSSGNVFADLGFDHAEAQMLAMRTDLMIALEEEMRTQGLTQTAAAKVLGISQSRVSDIVRGKAENFSLDMLVTFAARLGKPARIVLSP